MNSNDLPPALQSIVDTVPVPDTADSVTRRAFQRVLYNCRLSENWTRESVQKILSILLADQEDRMEIHNPKHEGR